MVGRTKLIRATRSPLIGGHTLPKRTLWPWMLTALIVVAVAAAYWYFFLR